MKKTSKDNTSNLFNRYVWLVDVIYRRGKISFEEINDCWQRSSLNLDGEDMPLRTFHNHRKAIEQMFDINIECDKRNGYNYYIENTEDMERGGVRTWLLNTFAVNNLINESHKLKQRILFEKIPSGQTYLIPIIEAMRDELSLEISYQNFWRDTPFRFEIYPYCVKVFKQRWYVIAYSPNKGQILIYALDRIQNLSTTENRFELPKDFDGEAFFTDCFGIIAEEGMKAERVLIKVCKNQDSYIKALPLHHSQKEEENTAEYTIFSYHIKPTYDFRQELLSHGSDIEVLSPEWFRNEMIEIVKGMCVRYGKNSDMISNKLYPVFAYGKFGFVDRSGNQVIPIVYNYCEITFNRILKGENLIAVSRGNKRGMLDISRREEIIPAIYDNIRYKNEESWCAQKGKVWYFFDGDSFHPIGEYDDVYYVSDDILELKNDAIGEVCVNGEKITYDCQKSLDFVYSIAEKKIVPKSTVGHLFAHRAGLDDYDEIYLFDDLLFVSKDGKWGYIDDYGNEIIEVEQDFDFALYRDFCYYIEGGQGKWGDPQGYTLDLRKCSEEKDVYFEDWKPVVK